MQINQVTKFKWFFAWQDEEEENWLHEMALQGWHLIGFSFPTLYRFEKGEPNNVFYRLDYKTSPRRDMDAYLQLFKDTGWEYCGEMAGWQYFSKEPKAGETLEIFTDDESKIAKYRRVQWMVFILFFPLILVMDFNRFSIGIVFCCILFIYAQIKLAQRIRSLRNA